MIQHTITSVRHKDIWRLFARAIAAARSDTDFRRHQRLGVVGICPEGRVFLSRNLSSPHTMPSSHAEARLIKKLPPNSTVFVARACKNGAIGLAHPCVHCRSALKNARVKKVYYTIDSANYGIMLFD